MGIQEAFALPPSYTHTILKQSDPRRACRAGRREGDGLDLRQVRLVSQGTGSRPRTWYIRTGKAASRGVPTRARHIIIVNVLRIAGISPPQLSPGASGDPVCHEALDRADERAPAEQHGD